MAVRPDQTGTDLPGLRRAAAPKFNACYGIEKIKPVDGASWKLGMAGLVTDRWSWAVADLLALPQMGMIVRHACVEGWDYIGRWGGPTLRSVLEHVGADLRASFVAFHTADDYPGSIDMATAPHPRASWR